MLIISGLGIFYGKDEGRQVFNAIASTHPNSYVHWLQENDPEHAEYLLTNHQNAVKYSATSDERLRQLSHRALDKRFEKFSSRLEIAQRRLTA